MRNVIQNPEVIQTVQTRLLSLLRRRANGTWQGTMTELMTAITNGRQLPEIFPASASSLRRVVNKVVPAIRRAGFRVEFTRSTGHDRTRLVSFARRAAR